jgi:hypothetical protein
MLGVCILHDLHGCLREGPQRGAVLIICRAWVCVTIMSEGVLIAIHTSVLMYVERPICMDDIRVGNHAAYDAHKKA